MHPLVRALLSGWEWRPEVLTVLVSLGILYMTGWRRLRRQRPGSRLASVPRLAAYLGGLFALALSLLSPIDRLGGQLFYMHMIQHMLSIMVAAPLLWLGMPFPVALWGLPAHLRRSIARFFVRDSAFRQGLRKVTRPAIAWLAFITIYVGWHDANLYNLALERDWVHDLEHITFFGAALLYWWHVVGAGPRIHGRFPAWARIGYLIGTVPPNMLLGVIIAYSDTVIYTYYLSVPRIWGITALQDQMIGGVIMWIPGSMMFIVAALIVLARALDADDSQPNSRVDWDDEAHMVAPGLEHRVIQGRWRRLHAPQTRTIDTP